MNWSFVLITMIGLLALSMYSLRAPRSLVDALFIPSPSVRVGAPGYTDLLRSY